MSESCFYCKNNHQIWSQKTLFLSYVSKPRVWPINRQHNDFKWGNIFACICTLVLSLWLTLPLHYAVLKFKTKAPGSWAKWHFVRRQNVFTTIEKVLSCVMLNYGRWVRLTLRLKGGRANHKLIKWPSTKNKMKFLLHFKKITLSIKKRKVCLESASEILYVKQE